MTNQTIVDEIVNITTNQNIPMEIMNGASNFITGFLSNSFGVDMNPLVGTIILFLMVVVLGYFFISRLEGLAKGILIIIGIILIIVLVALVIFSIFPIISPQPTGNNTIIM